MRRVARIRLDTPAPRRSGSAPGPRPAVERLHAVIASYAGHFAHSAAARCWQRVWCGLRWLEVLFECQAWRVRYRLDPRRANRCARYWQQYWSLASDGAEHTLVFVQHGAFVEFRGPFRAVAERVLGLRRARLPVGPYLFGAGFPLGCAARYEKLALRRGYGVVHVRECGHRGGGVCKRRIATEVAVPLSRVANSALAGHFQ